MTGSSALVVTVLASLTFGLGCGSANEQNSPEASHSPSELGVPAHEWMEEAPEMAGQSSPSMQGQAAAAETDAVALLESPDPLDREAAVYELSPTGRTLPRLIDVASRDPDPSVRRAAVSQLGDASGPRALAGLVDALGDSDAGVVEEAIVALMAVGDESVIPHLFELLNHPDPEIRELAGDAVEDLEDSVEL